MKMTMDEMKPILFSTRLHSILTFGVIACIVVTLGLLGLSFSQIGDREGEGSTIDGVPVEFPCTSLSRPMNFEIDGADRTYACGWAAPNNAFRLILCFVSIGIGACYFVASKLDKRIFKWGVMIGLVVAGVAFFVLMGVDANSVRLVQGRCDTRFEMQPGLGDRGHRCALGPFVATAILDLINSILFTFFGVYGILYLKGRVPMVSTSQQQ
eukprot:TRINITY_DN905_c0_g1_i1.p1 TRINITY_DN905_c0_g1~~TRINITY_DN905_c0_g1_i1.p1  ORF type:complete len:238 (+),score=34.91 TRINITY_DN905_c0_g1_i1:84-716(+)